MSTDQGNELRLREGAVAWRIVDGETILLDLESSTYLGVNSTGSLLWPALAEGTTRERLVRILTVEFDLPHDQAAADVDAFLTGCRERDLLAT